MGEINLGYLVSVFEYSGCPTVLYQHNLNRRVTNGPPHALELAAQMPLIHRNEMFLVRYRWSVPSVPSVPCLWHVNAHFDQLGCAFDRKICIIYTSSKHQFVQPPNASDTVCLGPSIALPSGGLSEL